MEKRSIRNQNSSLLRVVRKTVRFFRNYRHWNNRTFIVVLLASVAVSISFTLLVEGARGITLNSRDTSADHQQLNSQEKNAGSEQDTSARIMANGDLLYHDIVYISA